MPGPGAVAPTEGSCFAGKHMTVEDMVAQQTRIERCALGFCCGFCFCPHSNALSTAEDCQSCWSSAMLHTSQTSPAESDNLPAVLKLALQAG